MRVVAIVQARTGSKRLPRKVLLDLGGLPMLARVISRVQRAITLHEVIVATTTEPADEDIANLCVINNWPYYRGSELDVLDRYYHAAKEFSSDVIVRVTSDCPLIEPTIIDLCVQKILQEESLDYVSNTLPPRRFPRGLDVEVTRFSVLERAWNEDKNLSWREHVTPYIYKHPEKFVLGSVTIDEDYSSMRWTVDTPEDISFVRRIYEHFGHDLFTWHDVIAILKDHPEWLEINSHVQQKVIS